MNIKIEKELDKETFDEMGVDSWPIWECEPSTFDWHYDQAEICFLLEGKVKVETEGAEVEFGAGDLVTFPKGMDCTWSVLEKVKKHYMFS